MLSNRYAKDLVNILYSKDGPDFGAASDGMLDIDVEEYVLLALLT